MEVRTISNIHEGKECRGRYFFLRAIEEAVDVIRRRVQLFDVVYVMDRRAVDEWRAQCGNREVWLLVL